MSGFTKQSRLAAVSGLLTLAAVGALDAAPDASAAQRHVAAAISARTGASTPSSMSLQVASLAGTPSTENVDVQSSFAQALPIGEGTAARIPCTLTVAVTDPDGAYGTMTQDVLESSATQDTMVDVGDEMPSAVYRIGDNDTVTAQLACEDPQNGALTGYLTTTSVLKSG